MNSSTQNPSALRPAPAEGKAVAALQKAGLPHDQAVVACVGKAGHDVRSRHWRGLGRILTFFGLIILMVFGLDKIITAGLRRIRTSEFGVSNRIVAGRINADVVITGSSRAVAHYDPQLIQSITGRTVFNLGRNGSQTDMQLAVLKTYLRHNRKPDIVVHNLDAFSFVTTREVYDPAQYIPYLHEKDLYDALRQINRDRWWKSKYLPLYGYVVEDMRFTWILGIRGCFGWTPVEDHAFGFNPRSRQWSEDFDRFKAMNPAGVSFEIEPAGIRAMEELIGVCHAYGTRLIFVYSPEYREMQSLTKNRAEIFGQFRRLAQEHGIEVWDFSDWEHSQDRGYFQNSQHLNAKGAEAFSADLADRLAGAKLTKNAAGRSLQ